VPLKTRGVRIASDLELIVLKALRKEPLERYLTAEQLGSDVQAFLDRRPVTARRGTLRYRAGKFVRRNRLALAAAGLLAITLVAGLAGVFWQARVANGERHKAEARSADLRQLSNSLLSELDEAIKQLPGSTGVQKLLVTRVLEHLDRMAKDAKGDRLTQLDLVDAYTRLGNIQGNAYEQNLGDFAGALVSLDKALAIAEPLVASNPNDQDALRALATAQEDRGEVLTGTGNAADAVAFMQAAAATYDRLIALPGTTPTLIFEASTANSTLGDEMGQDTGLADVAAALAAYRKCIDLDARALRLDPNFISARRGLGSMQMKIGNAELDTDPAQALKDFQIALQRIDALPRADQSALPVVRTRAITVRKEAYALSELGEYSQALPLYEEALQVFERLAAADAKDVRALRDVKRALADEASSYENAANPALGTSPGDRRRNLLAAQRLLEQFVAAIERTLKQEPTNEDLKVELANAQVRLGTIRQILHQPGDSVALSRAGLAILKVSAAKEQASTMILDRAVTAFLAVEPASLRDPGLAVACSERGVALSHRKTPAWLLSLAQAYRAAGQIERGRAAANEGLALLPTLHPGETKPRIRKLLELETRAGG
ncbi:MAG TPA: hypothetical protein VKG79_00865, partial [Bryobacteraceae bacterium]|nr:hypothetical protein [Bryobacteraceae bacterium]